MLKNLLEDIKCWLGISGSSFNQLPFGPLEVGDVLTLGVKGSTVGTIKVIGAPSISNRPLGVKLPEGAKYPLIPLPAEERKIGFYTFINIDVSFNGKDRPFQAHYTGSSLCCYGRNSNQIFKIAEVRQANGNVLKARFKCVRPSWMRRGSRRLPKGGTVIKIK